MMSTVTLGIGRQWSSHNEVRYVQLLYQGCVCLLILLTHHLSKEAGQHEEKWCKPIVNGQQHMDKLHTMGFFYLFCPHLKAFQSTWCWIGKRVDWLLKLKGWALLTSSVLKSLFEMIPFLEQWCFACCYLHYTFTAYESVHNCTTLKKANFR